MPQINFDKKCLKLCHQHFVPSCFTTKNYFFFKFMWPCIVTNFFVIKPTRCTNFTNLFWHETLYVSDSSFVRHQKPLHFLQTCMTHTISECTVNELLMMDKGTVQNMQSFMTKYICEISAASWFYYKEIMSRELQKMFKLLIFSLYSLLAHTC